MNKIEQTLYEVFVNTNNNSINQQILRDLIKLQVSFLE